MPDPSIIDEVEGHYRNYLAGGAEREWKCAGCGQLWPCLTQRLVAEIQRLRGGREIEQTMLRNVLPTLAANAAENEALKAEVASLRAFQSQPRAAAKTGATEADA